MKYCAGCNTEKEDTEFWKDKSTKTGLCVYCIPCSKKKKPKGTCTRCGVETTTGTYEMCKKCSALTRREATQQRRRTTDKGYIVTGGMQGHPNARKNGEIFEHTLVMIEMIGRPLLPDETVHHKNKIRNDNRPENLELWTGSQPPGARVDDMVEWMIEFLTVRGYQVR